MASPTMTPRNIQGAQRAIYFAIIELDTRESITGSMVQEQMREQAGIDLLADYSNDERNALIGLAFEHVHLGAGIAGELQLNFLVGMNGGPQSEDIEVVRKFWPDATTDEAAALLRRQIAWIDAYAAKQLRSMERLRGDAALLKRTGAATLGEAFEQEATQAVDQARGKQPPPQ